MHIFFVAPDSFKVMSSRVQIKGVLKGYGKCPKILNTKVSDKMIYAISADPDQTAPSLIRVYTVCFSIKYFKQHLHKNQNLGQKGME